MLRKTAACGIVGAVAAITAAILWWPMDAVVAPSPRVRVHMRVSEGLPQAAAPAMPALALSRRPAPRISPRGVGARPAASARSLTPLAADAGRDPDLAIATRTPLESRSFVAQAALTPGPLPMLVHTRPETGGSAMARTGRTLGSAFKTTGASLTAAFSRLF